MKEWLKISYNRIFLCVLLLLIVMNVLATLSENSLLLKVTKPLFIPVFLMYYLIKNTRIHPIIIGFLICSFIGDFSSVVFSSEIFAKTSSVAYFLSYLCLVILALSKINRINFDKIIGTYLVVVFAINAYFLYVLFTILKVQIPDALEVAVFGLKSVSLIILAFVSFVVYLNSETKQSILYLVMALSFVFSDVLYYISNYYIYDWNFVMLDRVLHAVALFFLFNYMIDSNRKRKKLLVKQRLSMDDPKNDVIAA